MSTETTTDVIDADTLSSWIERHDDVVVAERVAGAVGAGLAFSAATNTCAVGAAMSKMPWNRGAQDPEAHVALTRLPRNG